MVYLGTIINSYGVKGELILDDIPKGINKIKLKSPVFVGYSEKFIESFTLKSWQKLNHKIVFSLLEVESKEKAELYKEKALFIDESNLEETEIKKFVGKLYGFKVYDMKNDFIGDVEDILFLPANDVLIIKHEKGRLPIPYVDSVVIKVDHTKKEIIINPPDGIFDLIG